jgi:serine/threonine protein kinase
MDYCPKCGAELADDRLEGLCAMCLLAGGFDATETRAGETPAQPNPPQTLESDSFGPYQIVRVLGEGGMGTVYLAQQTHPIRRQVALKFIKPGIDTRQILARFEYERQSLALMNHPNIACVYDAATEKDRPYFVMEYIDGVPITEYCDRHRLNTKERLELFIPVCHAVHHAHQKGVIHRDIKPSNVMVMEQDGHPFPKVIDFGIAKATDQRLVENSMFTQFGQFVGTPEYISPEQADVVTNDVDTTSDVYSLGVLLYELLVGAVPFQLTKLREAGLAELLRIIREEEAPTLPSKLTEMGEKAATVAERRRTDPASLRRQLMGDLNWIVLKAVEKDRHRRYLSVSDLAADILRHLEDQPVQASPPSRVYRARKFVRRHYAAVLTSAGVTAALVFGLSATVWQASAARRERGIALRERTEALSQKTLANSQAAIAEQERQAAQRSSIRAEKQADEAERQKSEADRQRAEAERRLHENQELAHSILLLDDAVQKASQVDFAKSRLEAFAKLVRDDAGNPEIARRAAAAPELVKQYSQASAAQLPKGWFAGGSAGYAIGVDQVIFHSGKASAFINSLDRPLYQSGFGSLNQAIAAGAYSGKRVRLAAFLKLQDVKDHATLWLRADSDASSGNTLAIANSSERPAGTSDWRSYDLVMDVPSESRLIVFGAVLNGQGKIWVDDFVLEVVDNSVAVTRSEPPRLEPVNLQLEPVPHK